MIDWNKPLATKSGLPARLLTRYNSSTYPVVVAIKYQPGDDEEVKTYSEKGEYVLDEPTMMDLVNIEEEVTAWVNVYRSKGELWGEVSASEAAAVYASNYAGHDPYLIARVPVTVKVGQGL